MLMQPWNPGPIKTGAPYMSGRHQRPINRGVALMRSASSRASGQKYSAEAAVDKVTFEPDEIWEAAC
jgi:hypothetical protein